MIAALRGAIYEALRREEEDQKMFKRLAEECKDPPLCQFLTSLAEDTERDMHMLKHLNLRSIIKYGLALKFEAPKVEIDNTLLNSITDKPGARETLKIAIDQIDTNIEYYEHIANHSIFPEVKRLFRLLSDKELEDK
ncbi:hypothetical protein KY362_05795, partial [Candidatus Woesearchaeota archaeon]|nr:hypothetical protein [Candidatus Woesearchaeota archaeon]